MTQAPYYSVVVALKDEAANLEPLIEQIQSVMNALAKPWELLCVDDGSTDSSYQILRCTRQRCPQLRLVRLKSSVGQSAALKAGFDAAKGEWIITLDADLQNPPAEIAKLCALEPSYDLVCGFRQQRQDRWHRRFVSKIANRVRQKLCHDGAYDTGCSLKLMRAQCLKSLLWFRGAHRFIPALFQLKGFSMAQVAVAHAPRIHGHSHYHLFNRGLAPLIDLLGLLWLRKRQLHYEIIDSASDVH